MISYSWCHLIRIIFRCTSELLGDIILIFTLKFHAYILCFSVDHKYVSSSVESLKSTLKPLTVASILCTCNKVPVYNESIPRRLERPWWVQWSFEEKSPKFHLHIPEADGSVHGGAVDGRTDYFNIEYQFQMSNKFVSGLYNFVLAVLLCSPPRPTQFIFPPKSFGFPATVDERSMGF